MNAIDILILILFFRGILILIRHYKKLLLCIHISGIHCIGKKYIDQEPQYHMRQICVLQWEEIKTKNSGAAHRF